MNVASLTKLTFYVVLPCFIFYSIYVAKFNMAMFNVFLLACAQMAVIAILPGSSERCAASHRQK